jgi:hypothetical protein
MKTTRALLTLTYAALAVLVAAAAADEPAEPACDPVCCEAATATCLACALCTDVSTFCASSPSTDGCEVTTAAPTPYPGWKANWQPPSWHAEKDCADQCCVDFIAKCLSCAYCKTEGVFCDAYPHTPGCPGVAEDAAAGLASPAVDTPAPTPYNNGYHDPKMPSCQVDVNCIEGTCVGGLCTCPAVACPVTAVPAAYAPIGGLACTIVQSEMLKGDGCKQYPCGRLSCLWGAEQAVTHCALEAPKCIGKEFLRQTIVDTQEASGKWLPKAREHWAGCCFEPLADCARATIERQSTAVHLGQAPYLDLTAQAMGWAQQGKWSLEDCEHECMRLGACRFGTYMTGGEQQGQCWLAHTSRLETRNLTSVFQQQLAKQLSPCGGPCVSFAKVEASLAAEQLLEAQEERAREWNPAWAPKTCDCDPQHSPPSRHTSCVQMARSSRLMVHHTPDQARWEDGVQHHCKWYMSAGLDYTDTSQPQQTWTGTCKCCDCRNRPAQDSVYDTDGWTPRGLLGYHDTAP